MPMASSPKPPNGNNASNNNGPLGKRKKTRTSKGSYLSKWLDKTMHHIQDSTPSMDTYDTYIPRLNWPNTSQFAPGYDPCSYNMYGCTTEPMSLPTMPSYYPNHVYHPEYRYMQHKSVQVQRPRRRRHHQVEEVTTPTHTPTATPNGTLNYLQPKNFTDSQDYASLPPIVTSVGDTNSNSDVNTNEKDENSNARRYSDPCVRGLPDVAQPTNGNEDSASETSSDMSGSQVGSRLLTCLLDQISSLKMSNERLNKELMETRTELESYRQNILYQKGSSPSMAGTPNHSPLNGNGLLGGQYGPGFVSDLVREIREAARQREEALYARVRTMLMERADNSLASSEAKYTEKALEEIKSSLRASEADKRRMMDRLGKLEDELRVIRITHGLESNLTNGSAEDPDAERLRLRKEVTEMKRAKQNAEDHALKLERLVTQLRSKFNGMQLTNGPDSLPSEPEHEPRARRSSVNSTNNSSTVVFGPVTDL